MCENRDGKFVVPLRPSAAMGWWIGQITSVNGRFYDVNVLRVGNPEYTGGTNICSTPEYLREFDSPEEAMDFLKSQGIPV